MQVREFLPGAWVSSTCILPFWGEDENLGSAIKIPDSVTRFIIKFDKLYFDERINMEPIEFTVHLPEALIDSINIAEAREVLRNSTTLELI